LGHTRFQEPYDKLNPEQQAQLSGRLTTLVRSNTLNQATNIATLDPLRAEAFQANLAHYSDVFSQGKASYAIPAGAVTDPTVSETVGVFLLDLLGRITNRPNENISYTSNWPYEPLVGNRPTGETVVWTGVSIIMLLAGISGDGWWYAAPQSEEEAP
jgi:nitric oxide reductase subunit B